MRSLGILSLLAVVGCDCAGGDGLNQLRPVIVASPSPLVFEQAFVGLTAGKALTLKNTGNAKLAVSALSVKAGSHAGLSVETWAGELAPNGEHAVIVRLSVDAVGPVRGAILVASSDPSTPVLEVPVTAEGARRPGPAVSVCVESSGAGVVRTCVDPLSADLGMVPVGAARTASVSITSAGDQPLLLRSAALAAGSHPDFSSAPAPSSETLMPGETRVVVVTLRPTREEAQAAVLEVLSDDPERERVPVAFEASGLSSALCADPPAIDFGVVSQGQRIDRPVTLTACGRAPVELGALETTAAEFTLPTPPTTPLRLMPGETLVVDVRYAPADLGVDTALFRARSSGGDAVVNLTGRTETCDLSVLPAALSFGGVGAGRSRAQNLLIENAGTAACTIALLRTAGSAEFRLASPPAVPLTLAPGGTQTVAVEYAPTDAGNDTGEVQILSDDPVDSMLTVPLTGHRLEAGECELVVTPDPVSFGVVALGSARTLGASIENVGSSPCTLGVIKTANNSDPDFSVAQGPALPLLLAGRSTTIQLEFRPIDAGRRTATLEIETGVIPGRVPPATAQLDGSGSGTRLCITPNPVIFGTHPLGAPTDRQVTLTACGSDASVISALELPAPTSSEYQLLAPPTLPLTIAAGAASALTLRYTGSALGRDEGTLRVSSNDMVEAVQEVDLIAATGMGCGDLSGRICGLDGSAPAQGVTVWVDTPLGRREATTNARGDYYLTCIPGGDWTIHAESGSWSTQFSASISEGQETSIPSAQCLDPMSARVAVVWGQWDSMESILGRLNIPYTFYGEMQQADLLYDFAEMSQYDVIFLNCGFDEQLITSDQRGLTNLRDFVAGGGSVYASDWAYDAIEVAWPSFVDFYQDDTVRGDAQTAGNFRGSVDIREASLRRAIGRAQVPIESCCTAIDAGGAGTTVYLEGDRLSDGQMRPFFVGFSPAPNAGTVMYTDFHNTGQRDIETVFRWLITRL